MPFKNTVIVFVHAIMTPTSSDSAAIFSFGESDEDILEIVSAPYLFLFLMFHEGTRLQRQQETTAVTLTTTFFVLLYDAERIRLHYVNLILNEIALSQELQFEIVQWWKMC